MSQEFCWKNAAEAERNLASITEALARVEEEIGTREAERQQSAEEIAQQAAAAFLDGKAFKLPTDPAAAKLAALVSTKAGLIVRRTEAESELREAKRQDLRAAAAELVESITPTFEDAERVRAEIAEVREKLLSIRRRQDRILGAWKSIALDNPPSPGVGGWPLDSPEEHMVRFFRSIADLEFFRLTEPHTASNP